MIQWSLDALLSVLLALTLLRAIRLERALTSLRRDRTSLAEMISGFDSNAHKVEEMVDHMRSCAETTVKRLADTTEPARRLSDDLAFLHARGERLADKLDRLVRQGQAGYDDTHSPSWTSVTMAPDRAGAVPAPEQIAAPESDGRARSKAEQDLLRVLRASR